MKTTLRLAILGVASVLALSACSGVIGNVKMTP